MTQQTDAGLDRFNTAVTPAVRADLHACCAARSWLDRVAAGRPYATEDDLFRASDAATLALDDAGLAEALAGHPRIGQRAGDAHSAWSRQEQAGVAGADAELQAQLAEANAAYEQRFGHVYLVCATGKDARTLLELCRSRLANDEDRERDVVLGELAKINRLRLRKLLDAGG